MNPGALDQRVTLQSKSVTRAANGEEVVTWGDVATVWASVAPIRGREFFAAAQMADSIDHRVVIRHRAGIAREMRVVWGAVALDIVTVIYRGRKEEIELMCVSGVRNGG